MALVPSNLAQFIDPEWVQRYFALRAPARAKVEAPRIERPQSGAPEPAAKPQAIADKIREALTGATGPGNARTLAEIRESIPEITSLQLSTNVGSLRKERHVERAGSPGEYRYWLTALGRDNLEA